jgi:hypothetical protein
VLTSWDEPNEGNGYLETHVRCLLRSFYHWTGKSPCDASLPAVEQARQLFNAPFVVLSHNTGSVLNYANRAGLDLFELTWEELVTLPSRQTAEPSEQAERERLLAIVARQGYIDNYRGVRVNKSGRRFLIEQATVWNLLDEKGAYYGQAAMFSKWTWL